MDWRKAPPYSRCTSDTQGMIIANIYLPPEKKVFKKHIKLFSSNLHSIMVMIILFYFSFSPAGMSRVKADDAGEFLCGKAVVHSGDGGAKFSSKRLMCNFV